MPNNFKLPENESANLKKCEFKIDYTKLLKTFYERTKNSSGLVLTDKQSIDVLSRVAKFLLEKIKNNIMKGIPIMSISLPIFISDYRSMLQVFAYELRQAPYFLNRAYRSKDPIERIKWVTTFLVSQFYFSVMQSKPFNPIIGETYQTKIGDMNIYLEQTAHKPPTGNFLCYDDAKTYKYYGYCSTTAKTGANSCKAVKLGSIMLEFKDGGKYQLRYPTVWIGGTVFGSHYFNYKHVALVMDKVNDYVAFVHINKQGEKGFFKKMFSGKEDDFPDVITGAIITHKDITYSDKNNKHKRDKKAKNFGEISGYWTESLKFNGSSYWERDRFKPLDLYEMEYKLPSDSTYRSDLIAWTEGNQEKAQEEKEKLENLQRADAALRLDWENQHNPKIEEKENIQDDNNYSNSNDDHKNQEVQEDKKEKPKEGQADIQTFAEE